MKRQILVAIATFIVVGIAGALIIPLLHVRNPEGAGEFLFPFGLVAAIIEVVPKR